MDSGFNMLGQFQGDSSLGLGSFQGNSQPSIVLTTQSNRAGQPKAYQTATSLKATPKLHLTPVGYFKHIEELPKEM